MEKKLFFIYFILILLLNYTFFTYADDTFTVEELTETFSPEILPTSSEINKIPNINARHAVVLDRSSNQIIYGKKETEKCKMASTTKILTSIIVIENCNLDDVVIISSKSANIGGSRLGLSKNDKITVKNLLYGLMLCSGNDAAIALAEHTSGTVENFSNLMNEKASEIGLKSSHFITPHGLDDEEHYTTALDLAILSNYALKNEIFSKIVKTKSYTILLNNTPKSISNTNELLGNFEGIYGIKTGFTNGANRCLVTACKRGDLDIICVVLGCDTKKDRTLDSIKLLNYSFNNFKMINIESIIDNNFEEWYLLHTNSFNINKGTSQILKLDLKKDSLPYKYLAIKTDQINKINTYISFTSYHQAPLNSGTTVGTITFQIDNTDYFSIDIINTNYIEKKGLCYYFVSLLKV